LHFCGLWFTLTTGGETHGLDSGEIKMVLDLLDPHTLRALLLIGLICLMTAAVGYSMGYKEGHREGYGRGKSVGRHISNIQKAVK
jgi:putative Mn2+ efflux pump MntP